MYTFVIPTLERQVCVYICIDVCVHKYLYRGLKYIIKICLES